jgi:hypothetical protein
MERKSCVGFVLAIAALLAISPIARWLLYRARWVASSLLKDARNTAANLPVSIASASRQLGEVRRHAARIVAGNDTIPLGGAEPWQMPSSQTSKLWSFAICWRDPART